MYEKIKQVLVEYDDLSPDMIKPESDFQKDLGLSSFDIIELCAILEDEYQIKVMDKDLQTIQTIDDLVNYIKLNIK